ncbi:glycosyl transferase [Actinosynnema sp. ALI-1.44]|uniref:activator-dependent family glycosyltransferase n=1 Tax=Actinosynnema sp. ALI-1.44 TaxID=1933779 RepID=UPI00097CB260|nr:activator-dependent family glycosyltransferase [Actinosynnema sp. ALI-1.44]ONI75993.1 glycosyl transferase [Actinosynnema sp. ALI-1.44]
MRVLFATCPDKSIFQYLVPLAWALRTAGHDVRVASQPRFADVITQAGLTAVPVGRDSDIHRALETAPGTQVSARAGLPRPYDAAIDPALATPEHLRAGYEYNVTWWHRMDNLPMISQLVAFARHWRPDLIIWEPRTFAGSVAAKAIGAAHARVLWSMDVFGVTRQQFLGMPRPDPLAEWLGGHAREYGVEFSEDMVTGQFTIDQLPDSLRIAADLQYVPMRHTPYGGPATVPSWLRTPPRRPRVALTLGLTATEKFAGYTVDIGHILDALGDLRIELVATLTDKTRDALPRVPKNTKIVPYVPLQDLAATCTAVIHHAGAATMATTSLHGVPQLSIPYHFDQPALAARLADHGAGLTIDSARATGPAVREAVLALLNEPRFRANAKKIRDEMLAMPAPNEIVPRLEELTAAHHS